VEIGVIAARHANRVNGGIQEAHRRNAIGFCLLVGQSDVAGPQGCGKTGAAIFICRAGLLVGTHVIGKIRVGRDVGTIPIGHGPPVTSGDHARELLPGRNRIVVRGNPATPVGPHGFSTPGAARAAGGQVRTADTDDVRVLRWVKIITRRPGAAVAGSLKEALAL